MPHTGHGHLLFIQQLTQDQGREASHTEWLCHPGHWHVTCNSALPRFTH